MRLKNGPINCYLPRARLRRDAYEKILLCRSRDIKTGNLFICMRNLWVLNLWKHLVAVMQRQPRHQILTWNVHVDGRRLCNVWSKQRAVETKCEIDCSNLVEKRLEIWHEFVGLKWKSLAVLMCGAPKKRHSFNENRFEDLTFKFMRKSFEAGNNPTPQPIFHLVGFSDSFKPSTVAR